MPYGGKTTIGTVEHMVDGEGFSTSTGSREMRYRIGRLEEAGLQASPKHVLISIKDSV